MSASHPFYILFAGECYYAKGGGNDFCGLFEDLEKACRAGETLCGEGPTEAALHSWKLPDDLVELYPWKAHRNYDWWHVVDSRNMQIVVKSGTKPFGDEDEY